MGIRSMNYIVLQPGVRLTEAVSNYLNDNTATITTDHRGTLIVYESNFTTMWTRDLLGDDCTRDLEEEITIQRFLGGLARPSFYMKRAGAECDRRGEWEKHPFMSEDAVQWIEDTYTRETTDDPAAEVLPGAVRQEIQHVMMQDIVGDYDDPDLVPEWAWVEQHACFEHVKNGEAGVWEFVLNLATEMPDVPERFKPVLANAIGTGVAYLIVHQGT